MWLDAQQMYQVVILAVPDALREIDIFFPPMEIGTYFPPLITTGGLYNR